MPELPEVETVRLGLNQLTLGQNIWGGDVLRPSTVAHPISAIAFIENLTQTRIAQWHRRGKYLLAQLQNSTAEPKGWLGVHLRMTGQLLWLDRETPLQKHTRVRLFFEGDRELRFVDQRTFGQMWGFPPTPPENIITGLQKLVPEPFSEAFSLQYLRERLKDRQRPIKSALLDQAIVAGVGNIYADEALFISRIPPLTPCSQLQPDQIERLRTAVIQVLQASIQVGGTTFSTFLNAQGINGNYGGVAWVYNRTGEPCRVCETPIVRVKVAGRSTHFCPNCQPSRSH
uniref:DNA-formamidopyrimidine glycosylase n=1 Tax=Desertifilum tharense IPPAS B-1220 TaxID=1781255 RepID=A0ACD5GNR3_9CYAN